MVNFIGFITEDDSEILKGKVNSGYSTPKSILEEYPEYNFEISSSFFDERINRIKNVRRWLTSICYFVAVASIIAFIAIGHWHPDGYIAFNFLWISSVIGIICYVILTKKISRITRFSEMAYYVQNIDSCLNNEFKYVIIVSSDRKWGLADIKSLKLTIPASFDIIKWKDKNKFVTVRKNGITQVRDVYNNIVL